MLQGRIVDIAYKKTGTFLVQVFHQVHAHFADALHGNGFTGQAVVAESRLGRSLHAHIYAISGNRRRIAAAAHRFRQTNHVIRFHVHVFHVACSGAYVFGSDVLAVEVLHEATEFAHQRFRFVFGSISDDYGFGTTQVQTCDAGLVGHTAGKTEHIIQCFGFGTVFPHAGSAQARAEHSIMDSDDGF